MNQRLNALRSEMKKTGIDVYYFGTSDYHLSEYVPEYFKTIRYFSAFTGSLATLLVDMKNAYIFVDGRYHIQADRECLKNDIKVIKLGTKNSKEPIEFINDNYANKTIGLDGKRTAISFVKKLIANNIKIKSVDIYSKVIENRAALSTSKLFELPIKNVGKTRKEKLKELKEHYNDHTHIVNNLECIAYLLNLRGDDVSNTPVFMSYFIYHDGTFNLFVNTKRLNKKETTNLIKDKVIIREYDEYYNFLKTIKKSVVVLDKEKINYETLASIKGNEIVFERSYIEEMKSVKNKIEIENHRIAQIYDGVSMVRFIKWLKESDKSKLTEYDAFEYLNYLRLNNHAFDLSFNSIVAYNANAASMHYAPTKTNCAKLSNKGILLVDSGGQYYEGTTDITRTISLGKVPSRIKKSFSLVLKSMFNLSETKFLNFVNGKTLDILARQNIWNENIDYRCGTGHGVGHVLAVHEGPPSFRYKNTDSLNEEVCLKEGNIITDEPGIYIEDDYGIRCENMLLVKEDVVNEYGKWLKFETLTLCPFDLDLIDVKYLDEKTIKALNNYHRIVYNTLSPYLNNAEKKFLKKETRPL